MMNRRDFLRTLGYTATGAATGAAIVGAGVVSSEYTDLPGFDDKVQAGRTKNSIAAVVAGIVGQKLYGDSEIDLEIQKSLFPNARVTGHTTRSSIDTYVCLALTSSRFKAQNNTQGYLEGTVEKSEFDWRIKQIDDETYHINRFGPKFDTTLKLTVKDGKIFGKYIRPLGFDWNINGSYDTNGNVSIEVDAPLTLAIDLQGKITKK